MLGVGVVEHVDGPNCPGCAEVEAQRTREAQELQRLKELDKRQPIFLTFHDRESGEPLLVALEAIATVCLLYDGSGVRVPTLVLKGGGSGIFFYISEGLAEAQEMVRGAGGGRNGTL